MAVNYLEERVITVKDLVEQGMRRKDAGRQIDFCMSEGCLVSVEGGWKFAVKKWCSRRVDCEVRKHFLQTPGV